METTINERIATLVRELNLTQSAFAHSIGKTPTTIGTVINGRNKPGFDVLEGIANTYPQISTDWLIKGVGGIYRVQDAEIGVDMPAADIKGDDAYLMRHLSYLEKENQYLREANMALLGKSDGVPMYSLD